MTAPAPGTPTLAYYPGCSQTGTAAEYDRSTRACCAALGVRLVDVPDWTCCGSTPAHTVDHVLAG
ncbi:MAG: heterodisulfide reductase-related iron-sulfur binding cluster, partial [Humidesulfovibrio sp.]|nr:heterodisulfide reductase-related iron-sulfur binding cluster [Humidesulfovibrio sp.]